MSCTCGNCNSNPIKICTQVNVPQVDDTALECAGCGFTSTACIVKPEAIAYLGLPANSSLTEVIDALVLSLTDARNRIIQLGG